MLQETCQAKQALENAPAVDSAEENRIISLQEQLEKCTKKMKELGDALEACQGKNVTLEAEGVRWNAEKEKLRREHATDEIIITSLKEQIKVGRHSIRKFVPPLFISLIFHRPRAAA